MIHRLASVDDVEVIAEAKNGREVLNLIREREPDLVFLDIQMPGMDGFDVLRGLPPDDMPAIVFVTAFDDYAIKAFEARTGCPVVINTSSSLSKTAACPKRLTGCGKTSIGNRP